jgi:hypothetical protein
LGLEAQYGYTPRVYRKLVHAATQGGSFANAADILREQAELSLGVKRLWRAVQRIGQERLAEEEAATEAYEKLPLPAQQHSPGDQAPRVACVQMDGGRLQVRDRHESPDERDAEATYWSEMKIGVLQSMHSEVQPSDPCPELPATFADPGHMREIAREIKGFTSGHAPGAGRRVAAVLDQPAFADELCRVPATGAADHQQLRRINDQASQPPHEGDREVLVRRRQCHADPRRRPTQRNQPHPPLLAPPHRPTGQRVLSSSPLEITNRDMHPPAGRRKEPAGRGGFAAD